MEEKQLKKLIITRLAEISLLKGIELKEEHYTVWCNKIYNDYLSGLVVDIKSGFKKLESEKHYGGLDYSIFLDGAKANENERIEKEWAECLASAKSGGFKQISARAGKAINSLGGIKWLGNNDPKDVSFNKRDFIASYKNTPEPIDNDFRCAGLVAPMYLDHIEQSLRDAVNSLDSNIKQLEG